MARVKRGVTAGRRHKKVLGKAKGYYNARRKVYRAAKQAVIKAGQYAYRDRRQNKREFRSEEHTSELQSQSNLVCRLLLEKKKKHQRAYISATSSSQPAPHS